MIFITALKTYQCNTNVTLEFYHGDKICHFDDLMIDRTYHLLILDLLTMLTTFAFLQIANFCHFDTFPDGWVGEVKIKIKDHLNPAEAGVKG